MSQVTQRRLENAPLPKATSNMIRIYSFCETDMFLSMLHKITNYLQTCGRKCLFSPVKEQQGAATSVLKSSGNYRIQSFPARPRRLVPQTGRGINRD